MRRTKQAKKRFRRTASAPHYHRGRVIKQGEIASFAEGEVSEIFLKNGYTCLDGEAFTEEDSGFTLGIRRREENGKYDVINTATGEAINEVGLTRSQAGTFISKSLGEVEEQTKEVEERIEEDEYEVEGY